MAKSPRKQIIPADPGTEVDPMTAQRVLRQLLQEAAARAKRANHHNHYAHQLEHIDHLETWSQIQWIRQLLCVRPPDAEPESELFRDIDAVLLRERSHRVLTTASSMSPAISIKRGDIHSGLPPVNLCIWQGDITALSEVTAITNAANSQMLGCFQPRHRCIDNVIHSSAGPRLRSECFRIISSGDGGLPVGEAKVTPGYCLASPFVIHTVGPQLEQGENPTEEHREDLRRCYVSVLQAAEGLPPSPDGRKRIALCGISTGLFGFPAHEAAPIAVETVSRWIRNNPQTSITDIIFNTFTNRDHSLYRELLPARDPIAPTIRPPRIHGGTLSSAKQWLKEAEAVIVTAGAGLSAAIGLDYTSEELFAEHFPGFLKFNLKRMYDLFSFTAWPSELDKWSYYFIHLDTIRKWPESALYTNLLNWLAQFGPDAFVRTSNADGLFLAHGLPEEQLSTPQGTYARLQCLSNCRSDATFPSAPYIDAALPAIDPQTQRLTDPSKVPRCPYCGGSMFICVRAGDWFNELPWADGERHWEEFQDRVLAEGKRTVILELGVGLSTPGVLRWPSEELVAECDGQVWLIRVGLDASGSVPWGLEDDGLALAVNGDIKAVVEELLSVGH